ncbi:MAG TPA: cysteine synthase family protein [Paludibacteraceae bacterium]|nr:cysteine synthase family protein [Paludibacteraceae bacterium]HOU68970.1 cysteine synthase family protein [Paludibacteraceae bacterium]HQF50767.1 cysteine synthase family protein [Paludibacteraceae bacterium]
MGKIYESIGELTGRTPLLHVKGYEKAKNLNARILGKVEYFNPNQSVKDRIALSMIEAAEKSGKLKKGDTIIDLTSGNTGIGLAAVAASKGYKFRVYIQDQVSKERFQVIHALGGETVKLGDVPEIVESFEKNGPDFLAAVAALKVHLAKEKGLNYWFADQTSNPANPDIHRTTTGPEIWADTEGKVDIFVACVGTGGTVSGVGEYLKSQNPNVKIVAIQPTEDSFQSPERPNQEEITGVHPFEKVEDRFVPSNLNRKIYDDWFEVSTAEAYVAAKELARRDGVLVGASSGATLHAATILAQRPENAGKTIVALFPDSGLRYLTTHIYN